MTVESSFLLFVNGTLMRGLELHGNLRGAVFLGEAMTVPRFRLYSIADRHPGMFEVPQGGVAVHGELYDVPPAVWQRVEKGEPPGLYVAPVQLADGRFVQGIVYPRELAENRHRDISEFGSWRAYIAAQSAGRASHSGANEQRDTTETKLPLERYPRGLAADSHESMLRSGRDE